MIFAVLAPLFIALFIPLISKCKAKIHTGVFVLLVPLFIFLYFIQFVGTDFTPVLQTYQWMPSLHINFIVFYLLFKLLRAFTRVLCLFTYVYVRDVRYRFIR